MIDLGKGVSVDFLKHPYVFGIEDWDPIRVQKGNTRTNGVSLEQLEIIVKTMKGSMNEQKPDNADAVKTTTRKARATSSKSAKPTAGNGHKSR